MVVAAAVMVAVVLLWLVAWMLETRDARRDIFKKENQ